uniref:Uncharacterized protein n=1 Tax=Aegilops tauschii subsp. strangulata TaxID=200361 RepID=A0A453HRC0_AEGTS
DFGSIFSLSTVCNIIKKHPFFSNFRKIIKSNKMGRPMRPSRRSERMNRSGGDSEDCLPKSKWITMLLAIAVPSAAPLRRPHHFRFLHPPGKLSLSRTRCAPSPPAEAQPVPPQPRRYPRQYPGEAVGVAEEMRFVAMRLRNTKRTTRNKDNNRAD